MMEMIKIIAYIIFVAVFLFSLFISFKFSFGEEGKDERGQQILNQAYMMVFPIFPIAWLLTELYSDFISTIDYETYRTIMWIIVVAIFIVHGMAILILKRRS
jgi:heme/copper-type cytochrome/quinol oxidase subunit 2